MLFALGDSGETKNLIVFGRTMIQASKLLWLAKGMSQDEAMLKREKKNKPVTLVIINLYLCKDIS